MNWLGIGFAIITMVLWGFSPLFDKLAMRAVSPLAGLTVRVLAAAVMVGLFGTFAGVWKEISHAPRHILLLLVGSALFGVVLGQATHYMALKHADASQVVPIAAAYPLTAALLAALFLHESVTWPRVVGALLVISGVALITLFKA